MAALLALARVLTRTAGLPALLRALPAFAAIALAATILFAGNGMRAADLVALAERAPAVRAALWGAWLLVTIPAARVLLETPETFFLRSLPVPPWHFWLVHGAQLALLQLPWAMLWLRGGGLVTGLAAIMLAVAADALWIARPRSARDLLALASLVAALALPLPSALRLALGLFAAPLGIASAWTRAPGKGVSVGAGLVHGGPASALLLAHAAVIGRRDLLLLLRGLVLALLGAVILALVVRNNPGAGISLESFALIVAPLPLALATGGVAVRALDTERALTWLLLATGTGATLRALVALLLPALWGALIGLAQAALGAALAGGGGLARVALEGLLLGAMMGTAAGACARWAELPGEIDGTRVVVGLLGATALATGLASWLGEGALPLLALAVAALAPLSIARLTAADRLRDPTRRAALGLA
jgi:hypothetical protein